MANIPLSDGSVPPRHLHWQKWVMTDYIPAINQPIHLYQDRYQMRIGWVWQAFGRMSFSRDSHLQSHTWSFRLWFGRESLEKPRCSWWKSTLRSCGACSLMWTLLMFLVTEHPFARDCMFTFVPQKSLNCIGSLTMNHSKMWIKNVYEGGNFMDSSLIDKARVIVVAWSISLQPNQESGR